MTNQKSNIANLLLLLVLVGVGVFWFKPNWDEVSALKTTEQAKQEAKNALESQLKSLQEAQANLSETSEVNRETVLAAIPEGYQQDKLINEIVAIAKKNDITLSSISFSVPVNSQDAIKKSTISLSMTGTEGDLLTLLKGLENNARKLVVKNVTVQLGKTGDFSRANFNISMETYYQQSL